MRARTVNENYPMGAANDPHAPWNEKEDDSQYLLEIDGDELYITRRYNQTAEDEWDEDKGYVDMEQFDSYAAGELGLDIEGQYENDDYLEIQSFEDIPGPGEKFQFDTSWGDFEISMDELVDMTNLF